MSGPVVCSIGMTDPWNAAGLGLDMRMLWECGARPVAVVAGVSAQDDRGIRALVQLEPDAIVRQWETLQSAGIAAVHVGALVGARVVRTVAEILAGGAVPVVYDPVLRASHGGTFADDAAIAAMRTHLVPLATVCTPNLEEAAALTNLRVQSVADMEVAARTIVHAGAQAALITGGHLLGDPVDVFAEKESTVTLRAPRIERAMRGSGGVLAAALTAALGNGLSMREAVDQARAFVQRKIRESIALGPFVVAD
jgi:hydroxymethylpyrimidine/phosphomethylpyrimidine kinase